MNGGYEKWVTDLFAPTSWMQCPSMDFPKTEVLMETMMVQVICVFEILISIALVVGGIWGMVQ